MGWSAGTFSRARDWTADEAGAIDMEAVNFDQEDDNFATGINNCLTKDGQNTPTADLPMGSQKHTGVGNATAKTDYASAADVIDQDLLFYADTGAANAYVITPSPSIGAYEEGQRLVFRAANANTTASTININGLGVKAIETNDGNALTANMIVSGGYYEVTYDGQSTTRFVLTSPHSFQPVITAGAGMTGGGTLPASVTLNAIAGTGITVNANDIQTNDSQIVHDSLSGFVADEHVAHGGVTITAGAGLTGGGTIAASRTIDVAAGTGITVAANSVSTNDAQIVHDSLSGFVADEHVAHSGVSITAGAGLTGGGTIAATRDIAVGAGTGITVNANDVALSSSAAGAGMTHTAGVLNVIGGDGITANANDVALSSSVGGAGLTFTTGVLAVGAGTGLTVNANDVDVNTASETVAGIVERATQAEVTAGTDTTRYVSPATLAGVTTSAVTKYKTADVTINSSGTLLDDGDMAGWALDNNAYYSIDGLVIMQSSTTPDWKANFQFSNTPQSYYVGFQGANENGSQDADATGTGLGDAVIDVPNVKFALTVTGYVRTNATTGGTADFQWAQNTSDATDTTVYLGSWLTFTKMA